MTAAEIYLPCDVGRVRVKVGFGDTLSPLEETALRVINALSPSPDPERPAAEQPGDLGPRAEIDMVASLLGLGYRVALDLVHDLWRSGYLVVDFSTSSIGLTRDVQEQLASGQLARLAGAETEDCTAELMVERLTGYVMPSRGSGAPGDPRLAIRFLATDTGLAEATHADIEQAVRSWLAQERRGRERRILSIRSAPGDRAPGAMRRWYRLAVQAAVNPDTDDLVITVTDRHFPAERRERASDRLTRLAQEKPLESWVTQLRGAVEERQPVPPPVEEAIGRLATRIAGGAALAAGTRRSAHLEWADESRRIGGLIDDRIAREADVDLVIGGEAHAAEVSRLISRARTQLVLVSPRIVDYVLERHRADLHAAIDRGVQLVILWGGEHKGKLAENARNALDSLARRAAKTVPVLRAQVSANTAVRMVVCDNREALVTSRDLLSTTHERPDIGLLLRRPDGQESTILAELLGWTRVNLPGRLSTNVLQGADRFEKLAGPAHRVRPVLDQLPEEPPEDIGDTGAVQAWVMRWQAHLSSLGAELAARSRPAVRMVEDGTHRELLWQALRRVERRLVIASGQLSDEVVNSRFVDAIGMLLTRKIAVTIGYDEHGGAERGKGALEALTNLAEQHPKLLTLHGGVGHARALVWDDNVAVGSYSYLFHAGYGTVGGRHLLPSELSVRLTSAGLADQVATACGEPTEVTAQVTGQAAEPGPAALDIDPAALLVVQRILNRAGDPRPGELVSTELRAAVDPWLVLDVLYRLGDPAIRRSAVAYCLAQGAPDPGTDARWRDLLVVELVNAGLFAEAQIVRAGGAPGPGHPPRPAASTQPAVLAVGNGAASTGQAPRPSILAALSRRGEAGDDELLLTAAFESDLSADERGALRAICTGELLETQSSDAADALEILASDNDAWAELAVAAMRYHQQAMGASTAELMREVSRQRVADEWLDAAWDRLEIALIEAEPLPKTLDGAKKTKAALYKDTGVLGLLRAMATRRDLAALRPLVAAEFPARPPATQVAGDLLDRTWRDAAPLNPELDGRPRAKYVRRLAEVVAAARDLSAAGEPDSQAGGAGPAPELLAAAGELAATYQRLRPALGETDGTGPVAAAAIRDVLARLDVLMTGQTAEPDGTGDIGEPGESGGDAVGSRPGAALPWPGQWQYPELAVALWSGERDPARVAGLLLRGLIDPCSPEQTARRLISDGEFAVAEGLRAQVTLPAATEPDLLRNLQAGQARAGSWARYEAAALTRRARRAGLDSRAGMDNSIDPEAVSEVAQQRRADADRLLGKFRERVTEAEEKLAEELIEAVERHPALLAGPGRRDEASPLAVDRWRRSVLACVAANELPSAQSLLDRGPGETDIRYPRSYDAPRATWPFPTGTPEAALSWYLNDDPGAPPTFRSWRPPAGDAEAWGLLKALDGYLREPSGHEAAALRDSLQWLVGSRYLAGPLTPGEGGWSGRLCLPEHGPLPRLSLLGRDGVALWIADSGTPPRGMTEGAAVVWLVTDFGQPTAQAPGTMTLDLEFLFRLLAPAGTEVPTAESRLVNLVRRLGAQLSPHQLTGDAQPAFTPFSTVEVAWLIDLLGAGNDGVVADALHFDSGGRREILVPLLDVLLTPPVPGPGRYQPLGPAVLQRAWNDGRWRPAALNGLIGALGRESALAAASVALMWVAASFYEDGFAAEDLEAGVRLAAASPRQADTCLRAADLDEVARRLREAGVFEQAGTRWRLPANGIRELLAGVWPGHDPVARAQDAIGAWFRHHEQAAALSRAELSDDVVRTIGHWMANRMAAARSAREREDNDLAWEIVSGIEAVHEMYQDALDAERVLPLWQVLSDRRNETEFINPDCRVELPDEAELAGLCVRANAWLLGHAFQNLLDNARQNFEARMRPFGTVRVSVRVDQAPAGRAEPTCLIDIEDDGTGISELVRAKFTAGEEFRSGQGRGTGLRAARRWFEEYRGTLEIMPDQSSLGGAWVRVSLPLVTEGEEPL